MYGHAKVHDCVCTYVYVRVVRINIASSSSNTSVTIICWCSLKRGFPLVVHKTWIKHFAVVIPHGLCILPSKRNPNLGLVISR